MQKSGPYRFLSGSGFTFIPSTPHYSPFGSLISNRSWSDASRVYRYGFNGKEKDFETAADNYDFGARIYDGRLGRWLSLDPLMSQYCDLTPFNFGANSPVILYDSNGEKIDLSNLTPEQKKDYDATIAKLNNSAIFRKLYEKLENSETVVKIIESSAKGTGSSQRTNEGINVSADTDAAFTVAQELFHAYQQLPENIEMTKGSSYTDNEAEGEVATYLIMNQVRAITGDNKDYYDPMGSREIDPVATAEKGEPVFSEHEILKISELTTEQLSNGTFDCAFQSYKKTFVDYNNSENNNYIDPNKPKPSGNQPRPSTYTGGITEKQAIALGSLIE